MPRTKSTSGMLSGGKTILVNGNSSPADDDLEDFLCDLDASDDVTVRIFRQPGTGQESMEWQATWPLAGMSTDDLYARTSKEFGRGPYRFMVRKGKELLKNKFIILGGKVEASAAPATSSSNNDIVRVLEVMQAGFTALAAKLDRPAPDPGAALGSAMELLGKMKNIIGPTAPPPPQQSAAAALKEMLELKEMVEDAAPPRGASSVTDLVMKFMEGLASGNIKLPIPVAQQAIAANPGGVITPAVPIRQPLPQPATVEIPAAAADIPPTFQILMTAAEKNLRAESYAEVLLSELPDDVDQALGLLTPTLLDSIISQRPDVAHLRPWFDRLFAECRSILTDDGAPATRSNGVSFEPESTAQDDA